IPKQTTPPNNEEHDLWWDTSVNPTRLKRWNGSDWVVLAPSEDEIDDLMEDMKKDINYNIIPSINELPTGFRIEAPKIDIRGLIYLINNDESSATMIDGGRIVTGSITTEELNVSSIFSSSAVIERVRSNIVLTTELNADKIVTGTLNASDVSI